MTTLSNRDPRGVTSPIRHNSGSFTPTPAGAHLDHRAGGPIAPSNHPTPPVADRSDEA
jgi:hypothetical protein